MISTIDQLKVGDKFKFVKGVNQFMVVGLNNLCYLVLDKQTGNRLNLPINKKPIILV